MNDREFQDRLNELGHAWQGVSPVEDPAELEAREQRHVRAIGDAIVRASETRRRERGLLRVYAVLAAAVALAAIFVLARTLLHSPEVVAPSAKSVPVAPQRGVRALSGQVTLQHGGSERIVSESSLVLGDALSISEGGQAEVRLGGVVRATALAHSRVSVVAEGSKSAHRLRLDAGRIEARVDDRPSLKPKLVVETPDVDVVVTGTVFGVDVVRNAHGVTITKVAVEKGQVVVMRGGTEVALVASGATWTSEIREEPPAPAVAPPKVAGRAARPAPAPASRLPSSGSLEDVNVGTLGEENAAFQAGIEARNRGEDAVVAERMGHLLTRYPASPLAGEALVERMRALARLGRAEAAAREARRYLAAYPDGFAREEARRLVLRGSGDPSNSPAP